MTRVKDVAMSTQHRRSRQWQTFVDGFNSINLDPSPDLRARAERYHSSAVRPAFVVVWLEVGQVLRRAAKQVMTDPRGRR